MNLSVVELSVLLFCAVTLGIVIHFFIVSRRNLQSSPIALEKLKKNGEQWKLKYFNEIEKKDKALDELRKQLQETGENYKVYKLEAEQLRKQEQKHELEVAGKNKGGNQADYIEQLLEARVSLMEHSKKVEQLMENIEEL